MAKRFTRTLITSILLGLLVPATAHAAKPALRVSDVTVTEGDTGARMATFTVRLSRKASARITFNYATADGTAKAGLDYLTKRGKIALRPGQRKKTVAVVVLADNTSESSETFEVRLSSPRGARLADRTGLATILDDDPAAQAFPALSIADTTLIEPTGSAASAAFTVSLSAPSPQAVTVLYTSAHGTAGAADYTQAGGSLHFLPGQTTKQVQIEVAGDSMDEFEENFFVSLEQAGGASIERAVATGTIVDDDAPPKVWVQGAGQLEADSGTTTAVVRIMLSEPSAKTATVQWTTADGTATAPSDYPAGNFTATFGPGDVVAPVFIFIAGDDVHEAHETLTVSLSNPTNATLAAGEVFGRFDRDVFGTNVFHSIETGPDGNLWLTVPNLKLIRREALANGALNASFNLGSITGETAHDLAAGPDGNIWFTERSDGRIRSITPAGEFGFANFGDPCCGPRGITAGADGNLWFSVGGSNDSGPVTAIGRVSPNLQGQVHFPTPSSALPDSITLGPDGNVWYIGLFAEKIGRVTPAGSIQEFPLSDTAGALGLGDITAGPDGNLWFTERNANKISRITPAGTVTEFPVPVDMGSPHSITAGADGNLWFTHSAPNGIGRITPAGTFTDYTVPSTSTGLGEITLGPDGNIWYVAGGRIGVVQVARSTATVRIGNDDAAPELTINDAEVDEPLVDTPCGTPLDPHPCPNVTLTVTLAGPTALPVTVDWSTLDGTAVAGADYLAANGSLTFAPGALTKQIQLVVKADGENENVEAFWARLANPAHAMFSWELVGGSVSWQGQVTIEDAVIIGSPGP